jgi:AcrR family transcriptional regulator
MFIQKGGLRVSPRNVEKDHQMREKRKQHILDSALQAIAKNGIGSVHINDIAREAQLSVVYNYFKSKEEILSEVLSRGQEEYGRFVRSIAEISEMDALDKLRNICSTWISLSSNWAFTIMLQNVRTNESVNGDIREAATRRFTQNLQPISAIMREGQMNGVILNEEPLELAFYFVSLIQGLTLQRVPSYEIPVDIQVETIIRLFSAK